MKEDSGDPVIVWITYGGYLIRAAPNQLEYASERERQLAELDGTLDMPWTILKGLSECQPGQYLDITGEADEDLLPEEAWQAPTGLSETAAMPSAPSQASPSSSLTPSTASFAARAV